LRNVCVSIREVVAREHEFKETVEEELHPLSCWFLSGYQCGPNIVSSYTRTDAARSRSCSMRRLASSQREKEEVYRSADHHYKKKKRKGKVTHKSRFFFFFKEMVLTFSVHRPSYAWILVTSPDRRR
jgi:hypothetical protein